MAGHDPSARAKTNPGGGQLKPVKHLPAGYQLTTTFDLTKNIPVALGLNALGLALFFVFGAAFLRFAQWSHPGLTVNDIWKVDVRGVLTILVVMGLIISIHEAVHGLFFWFYTRARPTFGFRWGYAFAAAPDWYLPRNPYLVVGMGPFVLLTALGLGLLPLLPQAFIPPAWFALTINAAGAVGDMAVVGWLLTKPDTVLVNDEGDKFSVFSRV